MPYLSFFNAEHAERAEIKRNGSSRNIRCAKRKEYINKKNREYEDEKIRNVPEDNAIKGCKRFCVSDLKTAEA